MLHFNMSFLIFNLHFFIMHPAGPLMFDDSIHYISILLLT